MLKALIETTLPPPERLVRLTVDQYHRMKETGILWGSPPVELLDGMLFIRDRGDIGNIPPEFSARLARLDVEQYHRMMEEGILQEGDPIELLDGLLVLKDRSERGGKPMTIGGHHNMTVCLLGDLNPRLQSCGYYVQCQGPIILPNHDEPEADGAILPGLPRDYPQVPRSKFVSSIIEVADSSVKVDRTTRLQRYAAAEIPQYVIINLVDLQIEVYEKPVQDELRYAEMKVIKAGETLQLRLSESKTFDVPAQQLLP